MPTCSAPRGTFDSRQGRCNCSPGYTGADCSKGEDGQICYLFLVDLHPLTHVGSRRMCLDPDVVPPLAGFRLYAILGVFHHVFSVPSVCIFKTAHCF
jgi:hypothetical protein